jgi:hypothetical protein
VSKDMRGRGVCFRDWGVVSVSNSMRGRGRTTRLSTTRDEVPVVAIKT